MTTRWQRINAIFNQALATPAAGRDAYLDEACAGDSGLRLEVARLLEADARASGFIEKPVDRAFERIAHVREKSLEGRQIGAWRVLKEIGRGGMGTVWLGERTDRQFEQRVAIKLIHPGLDTDWVLRRFGTERRILAGLDHPHIGRLFDGGTTDDGAPYFVMEFIEGVPIDRYCDEQRLSVTKRLELFRQVCEAVAFAHQHLVIHRDIKPSNVLVAGDGTAKLLDFGIATILQDRETGADLHTATVQQLMTPEYASPEQVQGLRATTLSDVYALGVMLYELLCGRPPYRFATRSLTEVARVIGESKPERPSTAITFPRWAETDPTTARDDAEQISALRDESVERLRRRLSGDLDTIVLKAMHPDSQQRYASVERFSEDIRRHLVGLPVIARPDTLAYRTRKFVRRNRVAVGAAMLVALALIGGVAATTWQARRAHEAQARAERRFGDLRKLAHAVLFDYHDAVKNLAGSTPVRERLVADGLEYLDGLAGEAEGDVALQRELAEAYLRMGDVHGGATNSLGNTVGALESYRKAHAIYSSLMAADSADADNRRGFAVSLGKVSLLVWKSGGAQEAGQNFKRAELMLEPLVREAPSDIETRLHLASVLTYQGLVLQETGAQREAVEVHKRQLAHYEAIVRLDPTHGERRRLVSMANAHIGMALRLDDDYENALEYNGAARRLLAELAAEFPLNADYRRDLSVSYYNDGAILMELDRVREALDSYESALAIVEKLVAVDPKNETYRSDQGHALARIGDMLRRLGDAPGALESYRASLAIWSAAVDADPKHLVKLMTLIATHASLAKTYATSREYALAATHSTAAQALLDSTHVEPTHASYRINFARYYADVGEVHSVIADESKQRGEVDRKNWRRALEAYRRSAAIWQDLRERGLLADGWSGQVDAVNREIARCASAAGS